MSSTATAHINFRGEARTALEFYHSVFGGHLMIATYADTHQVEDPTQADDVAFGMVAGEDGFQLMAYDVQTAKPFERGTNSFYITLSGSDAAEVQAHWDGLGADGTILTPIGPGFGSPLYGMLTDRFGITWIISQSVQPPVTAQ